ncbi:hypothetical protein F6X40_28885 [Paraburkholderia sp. UCT31]|uniref:hypothetical protein n=1 Tax=Paraburkholderia sp. UCT31 TaxID=2615209 RepID=UPI0016553140|nr:hypothetical protein [Paraburkholderia sp. UCT31]MBC8740645.1 hypothetical protein [Paraburkholderia sp. UCT31]
MNSLIAIVFHASVDKPIVGDPRLCVARLPGIFVGSRNYPLQSDNLDARRITLARMPETPPDKPGLLRRFPRCYRSLDSVEALPLKRSQ